jgi:hypothetical protein
MFATKHYLRGEDGAHWADYQDILPAFFTRSDEASNSSHQSTPLLAHNNAEIHHQTLPLPLMYVSLFFS